MCLPQIYTESLLCSGVESNIQLAVQHLTLEASTFSSAPLSLLTSQTQGTKDGSEKEEEEEEEDSEMGEKLVPGFRLSYAVSVELVVGAAKEYFNSAANLMDKDMDLAR